MTGIILLAGAWHSTQCWSRVAQYLKSQGHDVAVPELPGTGSDRTPHDKITLDRWVRFILFEASRFPEPPVLVVHGRSGVIASVAAERDPLAFRSILYVSAFMLPNGFSVVSPGELRDWHLRIRQYGLNSNKYSVWIEDPEFALRMLFHMAPAEAAKKAIADLGVEPLQPNTTPIEVSPQRFGRVQRGYVHSIQDRFIPLARQQHMCRLLPCPTFRLNCDHSSFLSSPDQLAHLIDEWSAEDEQDYEDD